MWTIESTVLVYVYVLKGVEVSGKTEAIKAVDVSVEEPRCQLRCRCGFMCMH